MNGKCVECGKRTNIGKLTKQCLTCLDWKYDDLNK
jgi:hypothetical protein